jgi:hypothetical protein
MAFENTVAGMRVSQKCLNPTRMGPNSGVIEEVVAA